MVTCLFVINFQLDICKISYSTTCIFDVNLQLDIDYHYEIKTSNFYLETYNLIWYNTNRIKVTSYYKSSHLQLLKRRAKSNVPIAKTSIKLDVPVGQSSTVNKS
ncbi:hypothetical protein CR513_57378, partial [Mucuna pruriens]